MYAKLEFTVCSFVNSWIGCYKCIKYSVAGQKQRLGIPVCMDSKHKALSFLTESRISIWDSLQREGNFISITFKERIWIIGNKTRISKILNCWNLLIGAQRQQAGIHYSRDTKLIHSFWYMRRADQFPYLCYLHLSLSESLCHRHWGLEECPEEPSLRFLAAVVAFSGPQLLSDGNAALSLRELCAGLGWQFWFTPLIWGKMYVQRFKPVLVMPSKVRR